MTDPLAGRERSRRRTRALVISALLLLSLAYLVVGDTVLWGEWLSIWPSTGWAVLLLPATIRSRSAAAAVLLLAFVIATTEWPRWPVTSDVAGQRLRLVVWNVGADAGFLDSVSDLAPDVLMIQESARPPRLPPAYSWQSAVDPAIVSRLPVEVLPTRSVGPWTDPQLMLVRLPSEATLLLANVRLMHPSPVLQLVDPIGQVPWRNHRVRMEQYARLAALVHEVASKHRADGIVLAGDFNTPASARSLDPLRGFLRDVWREAGRGWGATAPEFLPLARIDQCWVSPSLRAVRAEVLRRGRSDHRLLLVDLVLAAGSTRVAPGT